VRNARSFRLVVERKYHRKERETERERERERERRVERVYFFPNDFV
jgi:hypothetical protein